MNKYDIIVKPILSEKSFRGIGVKRYSFEVLKSATKPQIKQAVEQIFNVRVLSVKTMRYDGKPKRQGKHEGITASWKKAVVQLTSESKPIEFFESLK